MIRAQDAIHIRDPIHGTIRLTQDELSIVDTPVYQRLRGIKQLGFTDYAFPGATHTRYAHSLGATEMAGRMFDAYFPPDLTPFAPKEHKRLRQIVRLTLLLHDLGHPPLSHATEFAMPLRRVLALPCYGPDEQDKRANHEDYTIKLILDSEITEQLKKRFGCIGIEPEDICQLISGRFLSRSDSFKVDGVDYGPLLGQIATGELDADRMDYLQRDSYYAGVSYGQFDEQWLLDNLTFHVLDNTAYPALSHRGIFAFEDFLLSRYHMFVSVYYHHNTVGFDTMLTRFFEESPGEILFPDNSQDYINFDDVNLWTILRKSKNHWAKRIVLRQAYRRLLEINAEEGRVDLLGFQNALKQDGVDFFTSCDEGTLSRYYGSDEPQNSIFVVNKTLGRVSRIETYSKVFERYSQPTRLTRLYCCPEHWDKARKCLENFTLDPQHVLPL